jgi:hypothetical protein
MRKSIWVVLLIATLVLAACGPAMKPAASPQTESGEVFTVALPQIVVDFDKDGNPSVLGIDVAKLQSYGLNLPVGRLQPGVINTMTANNIQHIEMRQTGNGVVIYVNAKPMPYLAWSDESLQQLTDLTGLLGAGAPNQQTLTMLKKFLPIVRRLGLDLVLTFPKNDTADRIALANPDDVVKAVAVPSKDPASAVVQFEIKYDEQGVPGILGITAADLAAMGFPAALAMDKRVLAQLQANNIQNVELRSKGDGIFVYVNGNPLPNIAWDDKLLGNAVDLWLQFNPGVSAYVPVELVKQIAPSVAKADIAIMMHFPVAAGQTPIVAKMHIN